MLHSNPALYQLYKDLVVGGLISADEFWANRLHGVRKPGFTVCQLSLLLCNSLETRMALFF